MLGESVCDLLDQPSKCVRERLSNEFISLYSDNGKMVESAGFLADDVRGGLRRRSNCL